MERTRNDEVGRVGKIIALFVMTLIMVFSLDDNVYVQAKGIKLNYSLINVNEGSSVKLKVKGTKKTIKWSSSNKKVASVSKKGIVSGKKAGKTTVTAKIGKEKLKCKVTVRKVVTVEKNTEKKESVSYTDSTLNVCELHVNLFDVVFEDNATKLSTKQNGTFQLELLNNTKSVTWTSSNENIATVKDGLVTAKSEGNCTVIAQVSLKQYKCPITVTNYDDVNVVYNQKNIYIMLGLINKDRVKVKVAPLQLKAEVTKAADIRAVEVSGLFSHTRPDGTSYKTVYDSTGLKVGSVVGENLAYNLDAAENRGQIVYLAYDNLYASPGHRANMLNKDFVYIGISSFAQEFINEWDYPCVEVYFAQEFYTK